MDWDNKHIVLKKEFCKLLVRIDALKFGVFLLSKGKWSSYYIDLRIIPSFPGAFRRVGEIYVELANNVVNAKNFLRVAGIPTAGIPFASLLAFFLSKPYLYVRKAIKTHGRQRRVEGILHPGDSVLLVDDLITSGTTLLEAVDAIKSEGGVVKHALVLIDRQEGGEETLEKEGIKLHSLIKMYEVAQTLYDIEAIDKQQLKEILSQIKKRQK